MGECECAVVKSFQLAINGQSVRIQMFGDTNARRISPNYANSHWIAFLGNLISQRTCVCCVSERAACPVRVQEGGCVCCCRNKRWNNERCAAAGFAVVIICMCDFINDRIERTFWLRCALCSLLVAIKSRYIYQWWSTIVPRDRSHCIKAFFSIACTSLARLRQCSRFVFSFRSFQVNILIRKSTKFLCDQRQQTICFRRASAITKVAYRPQCVSVSVLRDSAFKSRFIE